MITENFKSHDEAEDIIHFGLQENPTHKVAIDGALFIIQTVLTTFQVIKRNSQLDLAELPSFYSYYELLKLCCQSNYLQNLIIVVSSIPEYTSLVSDLKRAIKLLNDDSISEFIAATMYQARVKRH